MFSVKSSPVAGSCAQGVIRDLPIFRCARNVQFLEQWTQSIKEAVANGSVQTCKERTACGAYLCDGERPIEGEDKAQISPVSAFINAELRRDPEYLTKSIGMKRSHETPQGDDQVSGVEIRGEVPPIQSAVLPEATGAVEEELDREPAGGRRSAAVQPSVQEEPSLALPTASAEPLLAHPAEAGDLLRPQPASEEAVLSHAAVTQLSTVQQPAEQSNDTQASGEVESRPSQVADAGGGRGEEMRRADAASSTANAGVMKEEEQPASSGSVVADIIDESAGQAGAEEAFSETDASRSVDDMDALMSPMESEAELSSRDTSEYVSEQGEPLESPAGELDFEDQ